MLDFARDIREVCPDALFLNYTNPMAVLTNVMNTYGGVVQLAYVTAYKRVFLSFSKVWAWIEGRR